jgi:hypothetical protein
MKSNTFQNRKRGMGWPVSLGLFCLAFAVVMMLSAHPGFAQTTSGSIVGTITDASGSVVPHTQVNLINVSTTVKVESVTDGSGFYQFFDVQPGNYKITVSKQGFKQATNGPFELQVEGSLRVNVVLEVGSESQTVTVTAASPLIQAETTSLGSVVDERETTELPLNGRNPMNLTALVPSVVPQGQSSGNTNSANPFAWGNYQIGGGMANQSGTFIDGSPVNTTYINLTSLVPTQDSLGEFKVDTNDLTADYGHLAGGAIQFSTKAGTNNLHGGVWEYLRNKVLDANDFWDNHTNPITPRGSFTQNQFGGNLGGPIYIPHMYDGHNKSFFFFNWEGFYLRQGQTFVNTVPTAAEVAGDMSLLPKVTGPDGVTKITPIIYDPLTTCSPQIAGEGWDAATSTCPTTFAQGLTGLNHGDRLPFPSDAMGRQIIPANRINQVAQNYINKFYPVSKVGTNAVLNNYTANAPIGGQNFETVVRIDHQVSDKQHIMSRYTHWSNTNLPQDPLGTGICQDRCTETFATHNWVLDDTYTINPTTILDLRLSYLRFVYSRIAKDNTYQPSDIGQDLGGAKVEFPGPLVVSIGGFDTAGTFSSGGADSTIGNASDNDRIAGNLTKIVGKHTLKFGGEYLRATFNYFQTNNSSGQGSVDGTWTNNNSGTSTSTESYTGAGLATFLLGYTNSIGYLNVAPNTSEMLYPALYVTDDWRVTPKLTAHLGWRWENGLPWTDRHNNISYFDPKALNPILQDAGITAYPGSAEVVASPTRIQRWAQDHFNGQFSPRFGFSYAVTPTTVVSGGYGLLWVPLDVGFQSSPNNDPINALSTGTVTSTDSNYSPSPLNNFSHPLANGMAQPPKRSTDPNTGFQKLLLGNGYSLNEPQDPYPYAQQWNFGVQKQFGSSMMLDVAYAGAKGTHLPWYSLSQSALPDRFFNNDALPMLKATHPNPFMGVLNPTSGENSATTLTGKNLVSPFPQYNNGMGIASADYANSDYHSLQIKMQKRFTGGASISAGYTYSKLISSTDTLTGWLESSSADNWGVLDPNHLELEKALSSNDVKSRLVVSYVYDIPVGRGKAILPDASRLANAVVGGWGLEGITTFQSGFPVPMSGFSNLNGDFGFGQRPALISGCDRTKKSSGPIETKQFFNPSCYAQAPEFSFGMQRNDSQVRAPGIDNWDASIFKNIPLDKDGKVNFVFRAEFFNTWNRTQFGVPNGGVTGAQAATVNSQANLPRLVQFAARIKF